MAQQARAPIDAEPGVGLPIGTRYYATLPQAQSIHAKSSIKASPREDVLRRFNLRWRRFRSLRDTGILEVRPLTVVIGPNNSGKSSLLAPLLVLKQTRTSMDATRALVTKGHLTDVGHYSEIVYNGDTTAPIDFEVQWSFPRSPGERDTAVFGPAPALVRLSFDCPDSAIKLRHYEVLDAYGRTYLRRSRRSSGKYSVENLRNLVREDRGTTVVDNVRDRKTRTSISQQAPGDFLFSGTGVIVESLIRRRQERSRESADFAELSDFATHYIEITLHVEQQVDRLLTGLHYLGPLRERPQRYYELSGELPRDVGVRGEYAPEILFRRQEETGPVNEWLDRFGFSGGVRSEPVGEEGFRLLVGHDKRSFNVADLGFGLSQVLPLLVQGFVAPKNSLLLIEQPEIHLNPRLQAVVADLFAELVVEHGLGLLVETHSEHVLLRLRRLIAEGKISSSDVAIYYVERNESQIGTKVSRVPLEGNGHIRSEDWPTGFFEDSLRESFGLAQAQMERSTGTR